MHPFMSNNLAKARSDEKLARGLAAYRALSLRDEHADPDAVVAAPGRIRLVDRLRRRDAQAQAPARPVI